MEENRIRVIEGKRIVNTRSLHQAQELTNLLRDAGAIVLALPTIRIGPPEDFTSLDNAIDRLNFYDWIIFSSVNTVVYFLKRLGEKEKHIENLWTLKIGAVGSSTRIKLEEASIKVNFQPKSFTTEALTDSLAMVENLQGKRILLPRSDIAPKSFVSALKEQGAVVDEVITYRTEPEIKYKDDYFNYLQNGEIDMIIFTSSSTFENLINLLGQKNFEKFRNRFCCASIGPSTSKTMNKYNAIPDVEAEEHTIEGLVKAIIKYYKEKM